MAARITQIRKTVMNLALPVTVSSLLQRTEGILAVFLVGGLGVTSIAAVGLGQLLAFIGTTLVSGLSVGANVMIAQLWGARRHRDAGEAISHLLACTGITSGLLVALGLTTNRFVMTGLGAEDPVIALATPYSDIIFMVMPLTVLLQVLASILQGTGDSRTPMYAMIVVNLLHVLVAFPLIYGYAPIPALGIKGAAIAVGIAEFVGVALLLIRVVPLLIVPRTVRLDLIQSLWHVGAPVSGERSSSKRVFCSTRNWSCSMARSHMRLIKWACRSKHFPFFRVTVLPSPPRRWSVKASVRGSMREPSWRTGKPTGWRRWSWREWESCFSSSLMCCFVHLPTMRR